MHTTKGTTLVMLDHENGIWILLHAVIAAHRKTKNVMKTVESLQDMETWKNISEAQSNVI